MRHRTSARSSLSSSPGIAAHQAWGWRARLIRSYSADGKAAGCMKAESGSIVMVGTSVWRVQNGWHPSSASLSSDGWTNRGVVEQMRLCSFLKRRGRVSRPVRRSCCRKAIVTMNYAFADRRARPRLIAFGCGNNKNDGADVGAGGDEGFREDCGRPAAPSPRARRPAAPFRGLGDPRHHLRRHGDPRHHNTRAYFDERRLGALPGYTMSRNIR